MRLPLPTPSGLLGAAASVRDGVTSAVDGVGDAIDLVPRAGELVTRIGALLDRVDVLVDRAEGALTRVESVLTKADGAVGGALRTLTAADAAVATASAVAIKADRLVAGATGVLDSSDHLLGEIKPVARALMPAAQRFANSLEPREVDAAITLLDRLPTVLTHLDEDVLPMLQQLDRVGPDVHQILEVVDDLREVLTGLPGVGLLKRFGDRKEDEDAR